MGAAEFATSPEAVVVHDPVAAGALKVLAAAPEEEVLGRFLFRDVPDVQRFAAQHREFVAAADTAVGRVVYLAELVGELECFAVAHTNPNLVFTRDAAITLPWAPEVYLASRMARPIRRPEVAVMSAALEALGLRRVEWGADDGCVLEGGDVVPFSRAGRRTLLVGYGPRSTLQAARRLAEALVPSLADEVIAVELAAHRMNLDGGLLPLADDVVVAHPASVLSASLLDGGGERRIELFGLLGDLGVRVVDVGFEDSVSLQACNYLCVGERRVIGYDMAEPVLRKLRSYGVTVIAVPGGELVKGRGGPRCLSRPVYRKPESDLRP